MNKICIIPARGGSKRIPNKNIKSFNGKPIIAYSIEVALASGIFDEVMVSTDSIEIADIARSYGANVPFLRSEKNANDFAGLAEVFLEVLRNYKIQFDICGCILPTAPLINVGKLLEAYKLLLKGNYKSIIPVVKYDYPIQRSFRLEDERALLNWPENYFKRSQDLEDYFHDSGQFYFMRVADLLNEKKIFTDNSGVIVLNQMESQDIDTLEDWQIAELKYRILNE